MPLIRRGGFCRWERQNRGGNLNICQTRAAYFCYASVVYIYKKEVRIQAIFSLSPHTPLQECVPIRHAITILNMLSSLTAPGNSNENSTHCFLHTAEFNYKAYHFDSSLLFFKLEVLLCVRNKKTKLGTTDKQEFHLCSRNLVAWLGEAVLLQILAMREWMIGGLKRVCQ